MKRIIILGLIALACFVYALVELLSKEKRLRFVGMDSWEILSPVGKIAAVGFVFCLLLAIFTIITKSQR